VPIAPRETSTTVTVTSYSVTLEPLPPYAVAGGDVMFQGMLTVDGRPAPGEAVKIKFCPYDKPQACSDLLKLTTGAWGEFYATWKPTHDMACKKYYFFAEHEASGVRSEFQVMSIAYPARLTIKAPGRVTAGQGFDVSGKLEFETSPGTWVGLENRRITIYCDRSKMAEAVTLRDGSYSVRVSIPRPGTYTLRAVFEGEGLPTQVAGVAAVMGVEVPEYLPTLVAVGAVVGAVLAPIVASSLRSG
jgi:hypothetical protein